MRNLLVFLLLVAAGVAALGYYLGWFSFSTGPDPQTGRPGAQVSVDQDKMKADVKKAKEKVAGTASRAKEKVAGK